jgi:adenylate cyclase, class 2
MSDSHCAGETIVAAGGATETEIKLRVADPAEVQDKLTSLGFVITKPRVFEANTLYDFPERGLQARRTILRLREVGNRSILTFKGPAEASRHKTREELETSIGDPGIGRQILERIGLQPGFRYEKYRTEYERPSEHGVVTLDETPVGWYLELEGAPEWIDGTATKLGFREDEYITESYGSLYLKYCSDSDVPPTAMVFS